MKIILPGGSGQIGQILVRAFSKPGNELVVLSRKPNQILSQSPETELGNFVIKNVQWDGRNVGTWANELERADIVINLAGRTVNCRYNKENRKQILDSRVDSTRAVGRAIQKLDNPPPLWLQSCTSTIYSHQDEFPHDEINGVIAGNETGLPDTWRFSVDVAKAWEAAVLDFSLSSTRLVLMRTSMTMSPDSGGVFDTLLKLVKRGLGGSVGDGKQFVSWIHERDFARAALWIVEHPELKGPINFTAPEPIRFREFMSEFRKAWGTKIGLPATTWMLEIATFFMRTESELVLKSRRVVPGTLLRSGFNFEFSSWHSAVNDLVKRWRAMNR